MEVYEQALQLTDGQRRNIGEVQIDSQEDQLLTGEFAPGPDFSRVEELFQQFEEAVNVQALGVVDRLGEQIAALGLQLYSPEQRQSVKIHDVQLWSDGGFSCQLTPDAGQPVNGQSRSVSQPIFTTAVR